MNKVGVKSIDVYSKPFVSMLEPLVEGFEEPVDPPVLTADQTSINTKLSNEKERIHTLGSDLNSTIHNFKDLKTQSKSLKDRQITGFYEEPGANISLAQQIEARDPGLFGEYGNIKSLKMQFQDDMKHRIEGTNNIIILSIISFITMLIYAGVSYSSS